MNDDKKFLVIACCAFFLVLLLIVTQEDFTFNAKKIVNGSTGSAQKSQEMKGPEEQAAKPVNIELDQHAINLLSNENIIHWKGNALPFEFQNRSNIRVIEPNLSEARALYKIEFDLLEIESLQFMLYHHKQKNNPAISLHFEDSHGAILSYRLADSQPFDKWTKFNVKVADLLKEAQKKGVEFDFRSVNQMWISSVSPVEDRIVFYLRNFYLLELNQDS